jgi:hypothetical protein
VSEASPAAEARALAREGRIAEAEQAIARMVAANFGIAVAGARLGYDWTSLNSLNGRVDTEEGEFFFKLHQEEGEEATVGEYYRGELLKSHGYAVDVPARVCRVPGRQVLLYPVRREKTLAASLLSIERGEPGAPAGAPLAVAQRAFDSDVAAIYLRTLHAAGAEAVAAEPIHRLFHARLCEPGAPGVLGGRATRFYAGRGVVLGAETIGWDEFSALRWVVNGVEYRDTLARLFGAALERLEPRRLSRFGAVVAHGDAHNANVWVEDGATGPRLVMFDPAFAGTEVPALLAEVKATMHNIFAHPFWLYHPDEAVGLFAVRARRVGDRIEVDHDWRPGELREAFLESKRDVLWRPLLAAMKARGLLPGDWRDTLRAALFACPTLVLNLLGDVQRPRPPDMALLGFALSVAMGGPPERGHDLFSDFLDGIEP